MTSHDVPAPMVTKEEALVLMVGHKRSITKVASSSLETRKFRNVRVHPLVPGVMGLNKRFIAE